MLIKHSKIKKIQVKNVSTFVFVCYEDFDSVGKTINIC